MMHKSEWLASSTIHDLRRLQKVKIETEFGIFPTGNVFHFFRSFSLWILPFIFLASIQSWSNSSFKLGSSFEILGKASGMNGGIARLFSIPLFSLNARRYLEWSLQTKEVGNFSLPALSLLSISHFLYLCCPSDPEKSSPHTLLLWFFL